MVETEKPPNYSIGWLFWAKIGSHPYWPCMISYDPANGSFVKKVKARSGETEIYHVQYFGKAPVHGWTGTAYFTFNGKDMYFAKRDSEIRQATGLSQRKKLKLKYHVPSSVMKEWLVAVTEAEKALRNCVEDRYELYVFKYDINFNKNEKGKRKRKRHRWETKRTVERIVSEPSSIIEPLCNFCEKGKIDLFCTSGYCTQFFHKACVGILKAPPDFKCAHCTTYQQQPCIVCRCVGSGTKKCSKCDNYYHALCMKQFKCSNVDENICSAHLCFSCYSRNHTTNVCSKGSFVKCFRCPTAFHNTVKCLPMGIARLSPNTIVCPEHFLGRNKLSPQGVNNVHFCMACQGGGRLICCEMCPNAYHAECLRDEVPRGDFHCDDCLSKKYLYAETIVWAKSGNFSWWPAELYDPQNLPENIKKLINFDGEFPLRFFGTDEYAWFHRGKVFPYNEDNQDINFSCSRSKRDLWNKFLISREEAAEAYAQIQQGIRGLDSSKPPPFRHIRTNRAIPPAVIYNIPQSSCACSRKEENPCGADGLCLNRTLMCECHPDYCPAGERCQNQRFQKREYAPVKVVKTKKRGWGLQALQFISEGSFVIEYVGEIITQKQYEERAAQMRINNSQNYYFLLLDRGRLIDAGPSGNLSRFINHSCSPNCVMEKWSVNGDMRIGIFALTDILKGEELTFNYQSDVEFGQSCFCGAPNCLGIIGKNEKKKK